MSGGNWNYMGREFNENFQKTAELWRLMAVIEHELDWGVCGDTCPGCARARLAPAIEMFFDTRCSDATVAIALMRDHEQNKCAKCKSTPSRGGAKTE